MSYNIVIAIHICDFKIFDMKGAPCEVQMAFNSYECSEFNMYLVAVVQMAVVLEPTVCFRSCKVLRFTDLLLFTKLALLKLNSWKWKTASRKRQAKPARTHINKHQSQCILWTCFGNIAICTVRFSAFIILTLVAQFFLHTTFHCCLSIARRKIDIEHVNAIQANFSKLM